MAESRFYYPIVVRRGTGSANVDAPFVTGLPLNPNAVGYACVLADDEGSAQQGLYIWDDKRWRFCLPQRDVSVGVIDGYTITVFYDQAAPITDFPDGTILFRNGSRLPTADLEPSRGTIFAAMSPVFGTGEGTVQSVNNVLPDSSGNVSINVADIPNLQALLDAGVKSVNGILPVNGELTLVAVDIGALDVAARGAANGVASLDTNGTVPLSQLPAAILGALKYQGAWDASANTPVIPAADPTNEGWYYVVSVAGNTPIDGITEWEIGDWLVSNGSEWQKIDNQNTVSSVNGQVGIVVLGVADIAGAVASVNGALPNASGAVTLPFATETVAGTVKVPAVGGLVVAPDGALTISPEILNNIGFTPINVLYVASNGDPILGNGKVNNPFTTIADAVVAATDGTAIVIRSPGVFPENVVINDKQIALISEQGSAFNQTPVVIEGFLELAGTKRVSVQDIGLSWSSPGAAFRVPFVGTTQGFSVRNLAITTSSAAQAVQIDATDGTWTGALTIEGLYTNDGKVQIDAGTNVSIRSLPQFSNSIYEVNGGTVELSDVWHILRLDHTGGAVFLENVRQIGTSSAAPAITSTAAATGNNFLSLKNVNTWVSSTVQSYVNKSGTCQYIVDGLTRNLTSDVWTGTELPVKTRYDRDTIATRAGVNYIGAVGAYTSVHFGGIDTALGQRLTTLVSAGGTSLVNDGPAGSIKGLASGSGIGLSTATTGVVTLSNTGVLALSGVGGAGTTALFNTAAGQLKSVIAGAGVTITEAAGVITFSSTAASGVSSINGLSGDILLATGAGLSVSPTGQTLTFVNEGVLALTSTSVSGSYSLVNNATGELKGIRPGVGVTMSEASGIVTINSSGGGGGGVATLNGLQGDVELVAGSNITIAPVGNTLVLNATGGGGTGGLNAVTNTVGTGAGLVADDGASSGTATVKRVVAGTNVSISESAAEITVSTDIGDFVSSVAGQSGAVQIAEGTDIGILAENGVVTISYTGSNAGTKVSSLNGLTNGVTLNSTSPNLAITTDPIGNTVDLELSGLVTQVSNAESTAPGATALVSNSGSATGTAVVKQVAPGANVLFDDDGTTLTLNVIGGSGTVKSVNNVEPQDPLTGNVQIDATVVGALPIDGGQMQGAIDMSNQAINNLPNPVADGDPVTLGFLGSGDLIIDNGEI